MRTFMVSSRVTRSLVAALPALVAVAAIGSATPACDGSAPASDFTTEELALQNNPGYCPTGLTYATPVTLDTAVTSQDGSTVSVAGLASEDSAVAWTDGVTLPDGTYGHVVDLAVVGQDLQIIQNLSLDHFTGTDTQPSISSAAGDTGERFVAAWRGIGTGYSKHSVRSRTYGRTGGQLSQIADFDVPGFPFLNSAQHRVQPQAQYLWTGVDIAYVWVVDFNGDLQPSSGDYIEYTRCTTTGACTAPCSSNPTECLVNTDVDGPGNLVRKNPRLDAFRVNGGFVVVWTGDGVANNNTLAYDHVFYRRFDGNGAPLDTYQQSAVPTEGNPYYDYADVTALSVGTSDRFVVVWQVGSPAEQNPDIFFRIFNHNGTIVKDVTEIGDTTAKRRFPRVAAKRWGNWFYVAYNEWDPGTSAYVLKVARFDNNGNQVGTPHITTSDTFGSSKSELFDLDTTQCSSFVQGYHRSNIFLEDVRMQYPPQN